MSKIKYDIESFYSELRILFPKLNSLELWEEYDWENENSEAYIVMEEIAEEMLRWNESNNFTEIENLLNYIESSIKIYDNYVTTCIYTDFFPTIISCNNKKLREKIKTHLGAESKIYYNKLLTLYSEQN
jgi:hypothetical protein